MKINKQSLLARAKNLSKEKGVTANVILLNYFFDAFLKRLAKSRFANEFVFKGGFLLSSVLGAESRSTMDIDFLLRNLLLSADNIKRIFQEVIAIEADDCVTFEFGDKKEIRQDDDYGGYGVTLIGHLENIKVPVNVDVATGDPITPNPTTHDYNCIFTGERLEFLAHNFETILSEKLETVFKRGLSNSRCKDFYDLYMIYKSKWGVIDVANFKDAFKNTCQHRQSAFSKEEAKSMLFDLANAETMKSRWRAYQKKNAFARNIQYEETIEAISEIVEYLFA